MRRHLVILATATGIGIAASPAGAHHSHSYFYDQCKSTTINGRVESVQWKDPHTVIILRQDDATAYTVDWNGLSALTNDRIVGPTKAALVAGARIEVTGNPIRSTTQIREHFPDYTNEVNPKTIDPRLIRRVGNRWNWAARPVQNPPDCKGE